MKFIVNYINVCKVYTPSRNHTSIQCKFKTGGPQGGVLSRTLLNIYHHQEHRLKSCLTQMTSPSHLHTQARIQPINTYNHTYIHCFGLHKTTCTPDPAEYKSNLVLKINTSLPMETYQKVLGLALDPKLTYSTHSHKISVHAHKPRQIIKELITTAWTNRRKNSCLPKRQL